MSKRASNNVARRRTAGSSRCRAENRCAACAAMLALTFLSAAISLQCASRPEKRSSQTRQDSLRSRALPDSLQSARHAPQEPASRLQTAPNPSGWHPDTSSMASFGFVYKGNGFFKVKPGLKIEPHTIFKRYGRYLGLGPEDRMVLCDSAHESLRDTLCAHYRFQQYHEGLEVNDAEYLVHVWNGAVSSINGLIVHGIRASARPSLSESTALHMALDSIKSPGEVPGSHRKLLFVDPTFSQDGSRYVLAYQFQPTYNSISPDRPGVIYVDAATGRIILSFPSGVD